MEEIEEILEIYEKLEQAYKKVKSLTTFQTALYLYMRYGDCLSRNEESKEKLKKIKKCVQDCYPLFNAKLNEKTENIIYD